MYYRYLSYLPVVKKEAKVPYVGEDLDDIMAGSKVVHRFDQIGKAPLCVIIWCVHWINDEMIEVWQF
jgi:hypothetical protein